MVLTPHKKTISCQGCFGLVYSWLCGRALTLVYLLVFVWACSSILFGPCMLPSMCCLVWTHGSCVLIGYVFLCFFVSTWLCFVSMCHVLPCLLSNPTNLVTWLLLQMLHLSFLLTLRVCFPIYFPSVFCPVPVCRLMLPLCLILRLHGLFLQHCFPPWGCFVWSCFILLINKA